MLSFDWDDGNIDHIARHGVSPTEAEYVLEHATLDIGYENWYGEERYAEVGATASGRVLLIWTTWRQDSIRVVTAFDASQGDVLEYLQMVTL